MTDLPERREGAVGKRFTDAPGDFAVPAKVAIRMGAYVAMVYLSVTIPSRRLPTRRRP